MNLRVAMLIGGLMSWAASPVLAQDGGSRPGVARAVTQVSVGVSLIDKVSVTTMRDMNLNAANAVDNFITITPVTSSLAGLMRLDGIPGRLVRITYLTTETMVEEGGSGGVVRAEYRISGFESDNQGASALLDIGEATIRLSRQGVYFLWLGARLDISRATAGNYISEFIIELDGN
jgi:hypothetical protein